MKYDAVLLGDGIIQSNEPNLEWPVRACVLCSFVRTILLVKVSKLPGNWFALSLNVAALPPKLAAACFLEKPLLNGDITI
jgi:hypothetical protein